MSELKKDISLLVVLGLLTLGIVMLGFTLGPSIFERFMLFFEPGLGSREWRHQREMYLLFDVQPPGSTCR